LGELTAAKPNFLSPLFYFLILFLLRHFESDEEWQTGALGFFFFPITTFLPFGMKMGQRWKGGGRKGQIAA
jgi:hypothetical protein